MIALARNTFLAGSALAVVLFLPACDWMPGKPVRAVDQWQNPHDIVDFKTLFAQNCQGCHGFGKQIAGAISLDTPAYVAIVPRQTLHDIIANGVPNSPMPYFSEANGGMLTEKQIGILVDGIKAWAKPITETLPPYAAAPGNADAGKTLYDAYLAGAQKAAGSDKIFNSDKMFKDGFLTNPTFLGLSTDQYLRTLIITGRPELGIPDWRTIIPGRPLSDQDISDLVAWLISQRKNEFGQPLSPGQQPVAP